MIDKEKFKILIVDDERSNILALNHILKPTYSTFAAIDGKTALHITREIFPDLILLDVIMPDISGFEVLAELKHDDLTRKIPVIFITSLDSIEDEEKGFALGAVDYITKPFHSAIVRARVKMQQQIIEYIRTIEQLSTVDMLTNVFNRRGFDERIGTEWHRAIREGESLSVLMIDIDKFKNYNDTYGHLQGDLALQTVAEVIKQTLKRALDFVSRFGGEEFIVLLPNTDLDGALVVAEEIRANIERAVIPETTTSITVSIGVHTQVPVINDRIDLFISGADIALYAAKESGRNRVCYTYR